MKKTVLLLLTVSVLFAACNNATKQLGENIAGADSVAINYFKGDGKMDTVTAVTVIRDQNAIETITAFVTESSSTIRSSCGYDGSIHFFKNDRVVQDIFFSAGTAPCRQFLFRVNGQDAASELNEKAKAFLMAQKQK